MLTVMFVIGRLMVIFGMFVLFLPITFHIVKQIHVFVNTRIANGMKKFDTENHVT